MIPQLAVFSLCFAASVFCAVLLWRAYTRTRTRLLLLSTISFALFALNNALVVVDIAWIHAVNVSITRLLIMLAAVSVMVAAFVWGDE